MGASIMLDRPSFLMRGQSEHDIAFRIDKTLAGRDRVEERLASSARWSLLNPAVHSPKGGWFALRNRKAITLVALQQRPLTRPSLSTPVQGPVLHGFGDVRGLDIFGGGEIGDGAGDLEHAVVGAGGEV